jgi:uncharacterized membrane protein
LFLNREEGEVLLITVEVKQRVFINLPAEDIFAYISNLENLSNWSSAIVRAKKISGGEIQLGTRVHSTVRFLSKWSDMTLEIVEYECNHVLTIKSTNGIAPCTIFYQLESERDGGTTVSQETVIHVIEGVAEVAESVVTNAIRRQLEYDLLTLKDMLETRAPVYKLVD